MTKPTKNNRNINKRSEKNNKTLKVVLSDIVKVVDRNNIKKESLEWYVKLCGIDFTNVYIDISIRVSDYLLNPTCIYNTYKSEDNDMVSSRFFIN